VARKISIVGAVCPIKSLGKRVIERDAASQYIVTLFKQRLASEVRTSRQFTQHRFRVSDSFCLWE